ncbi:transcriptional regulator GutM [Enterococcus sp. DIV0756]|uniref:transcriptional regulator GutM n=1 Tax=Enterococcus sp. DIV0756 TaxID=2774636 RepID=UPI003F28DF2D
MIYFIGILAISAYILQVLLGIRQFKYFNRQLRQMRSKGRVAIGVNKGRIASGTIILFAIDEQFQIHEAKKMQGISSFTMFKPFTNVVGQNLLELTKEHPALAKENKLTQKAVIHAVESCLQPEPKTENNYQPMYSLENLKWTVKNQLLLCKQRIKRS